MMIISCARHDNYYRYNGADLIFKYNSQKVTLLSLLLRYDMYCLWTTDVHGWCSTLRVGIYIVYNHYGKTHTRGGRISDI